MTNEIISQLSKKQAITFLKTAIKDRTFDDSGFDSLLLENELQVDENGDFCRFLLSELIEKDKNDELGLTKQLIKNKEWLAEERISEQETRGDIAEIIGIIIGVLGLLQNQYNVKKEDVKEKYDKKKKKKKKK
jgi:hypothetical protein